MTELPPLPVPPSGDSPDAPAIPPPPGAEPPQPVPHELPHRVAGLSCPNCAGVLEIDTGLRVVICPYCQTHLLALTEIGARRFAVAPKFDSPSARQEARTWLSRGVHKDRRLRREAEVGEAFLSFLPFYRVEADCVGFALGTEERRRTVGSGKNRRTEVYEVDVERSAAESFDRTYPAVNVGEWGIRKVHLDGDLVAAFDAEALATQGMVFPPSGSESDVLAAALEQFKRETDPSAGLTRVRFRFLETLRERLSIVYYPMWVVRYRFRGRSYQVLVDAEDGRLAYGKAAGNDLYRALMLVATTAAAAFIATTSLQVAGANVFSLLAAGLGLAIFGWGWKRFRYGGVVIEGSCVTLESGPPMTLGAAMKSAESIVVWKGFGRRGR